MLNRARYFGRATCFLIKKSLNNAAPLSLKPPRLTRTTPCLARLVLPPSSRLARTTPWLVSPAPPRLVSPASSRLVSPAPLCLVSPVPLCLVSPVPLCLARLVSPVPLSPAPPCLACATLPRLTRHSLPATMPTERIALVSPGKRTRNIEVQLPRTRSGVKAAAATGPDPDRSWDIVEYHHSAGGGTVGKRPRRAHRARIRRNLLAPTQDKLDDVLGSVRALTEKCEWLQTEIHVERRARHREVEWLQSEIHAERRARQREVDSERRDRQRETEQLHNRVVEMQSWRIREKERNISFDRVTEQYEVVDRCLRGFNDIIFDTQRTTNGIQVVLTQDEKVLLKYYGLNYITRLLWPPIDLEVDADQLRLRALNILNVEQQRLCYRLLELLDTVKGKHNDLHHPRPDRATAYSCLSNYLDPSQCEALDSFLEQNPRRLPMYEDLFEEDPDTLLFARRRDYVSVTDQPQVGRGRVHPTGRKWLSPLQAVSRTWGKSTPWVASDFPPVSGERKLPLEWASPPRSHPPAYSINPRARTIARDTLDIDVLVLDTFANEMFAHIDVFHARAWPFVSFANDAAPILSQYITAGRSCGMRISSRNPYIHNACFAPRERATYSASVVDSATVDCFFDTQETGPPDIMNTSPEVEQRVSRSEA
ncbi:hypothetical protein GGX14DRAFT_577316 [Mycena pura]|uniref:Uncharacterized protein n=1 Tax=Mycena pura TaxID=153505 RepID=A0AAD6Y425_9AGAR|nr:hypothetical protein GGX14DRAFT_577316 [Mycena pura]